MVNEGFEADVNTMSMFVDLLSSDQIDASSKKLLQKSFLSPKDKMDVNVNKGSS